MPQISRSRSFYKSLVISLMVVFLTLSLHDATLHQIALACPGPTGVSYPGTEAFTSTIMLQMPFIAGETWTVGGGGSFYGNGAHCNDPNNDYYATDWNRTNDNGAAVLPVAEGKVSAIQNPCPVQTGYGCFVVVDHANGYRTLYAHLSQVLVVTNTVVHPWTLIGKVGNSGTVDPHLHLAFRHLDNGGYYSHCNTAIPPSTTCPNGETPLAPQGYRPSPMMTTLGPTILQDNMAYTSVNGRIYLPDLRSDDTGVVTQLYVRNDGTELRSAKVSYYKADGTPTAYGSDTCVLWPNQRCWIPVYLNNRLPAGTTGTGFVDGGEAVSVFTMQSHYPLPQAFDDYLGVSQPITQVYVPLVEKNNYGLYSEIYLQNPWPTVTDVTIQYTVSPGKPGTSCSETYTNVPARGLKIVPLSNVSCVGSTFVGSLYITNTAKNQLAVATNLHKSDQSSLQESSYTGGVTNTVYAPLIQNNNYNWISGMAIQNASEGTRYLSAVYYNWGDGSQCRGDVYFDTGAHVSQIALTPFVGCTRVASGVFSSGGVTPVSVIVNQILPNSPSSTTYAAVTTPSKIVVIPWWRNGFQGWYSGLVVQNVNNQLVNVTLTFYDSGGNQSGTPVNTQIQPHAIYVTNYTGVTDGAVIVTADQLVAVAVNHITNISGDGNMSHAGVPR